MAGTDIAQTPWQLPHKTSVNVSRFTIDLSMLILKVTCSLSCSHVVYTTHGAYRKVISFPPPPPFDFFLLVKRTGRLPALKPKNRQASEQEGAEVAVRLGRSSTYAFYVRNISGTNLKQQQLNRFAEMSDGEGSFSRSLFERECIPADFLKAQTVVVLQMCAGREFQTIQVGV